MRALNQKQKKIILNEMSKRDIFRHTDLGIDILTELENINDFETIWIETNIFIRDTRNKMGDQE
jgi:hypothetical protein